MKWTKELPTKQGWYWTDYEYTQVVFVYSQAGSYRFTDRYEDENDNGDLQEYCKDIRVQDIKCRWAGPINKPIGTYEFKEVADYLNERYGTLVTAKDVEKAADEDPYLQREIEDDSYTDTSPRERFIDDIAINRVGMRWPLYGDTEEYGTKFYAKAAKAGMLGKDKNGAD